MRPGREIIRAIPYRQRIKGKRFLLTSILLPEKPPFISLPTYVVYLSYVPTFPIILAKDGSVHFFVILRVLPILRSYVSHVPLSLFHQKLSISPFPKRSCIL